MGKYTKDSRGYYRTNVQLGYDSSGKRIRKALFARTIKELEEKIIQAKTNKPIKESTMSLEEYALNWFNIYKANSSINTKAMYDNIINKHIVPNIGHIPLDKLVKSDVQELININFDKYETCNKILLTIRQILDSAIDDELLSKNIAKNITLPPKPKSSKRSLTKSEKQAILASNLNDMQRAYINVLLYSGLRREEALALTKKDISDGYIIVNKAIIFDKNTPVLSTTKNETSNRKVPIPNKIFEELKKYSDKVNTLYLFTKKDGTLMTHSSYVKFWNNVIKELNAAIQTDSEKKMNVKPITGLTAHIFRHNYATMLYYSNISIKQAAALMGHTDTKMILNVYSHLDEERENVIEKINEFVNIS